MELRAANAADYLKERGIELVRVARREQGVRLYEVTPSADTVTNADTRLRGPLSAKKN